MQFLEMKRNEVLERLKLEKIPKDYRKIFKFLLKKHCRKFSDLLLNKNCEIRSCEIYKGANEFYNKINSIILKTSKKIYIFEIWYWIYPLDTNHSKIWLTNLREICYRQCYSKEFDFSLKHFYIICYYGDRKSVV